MSNNTENKKNDEIEGNHQNENEVNENEIFNVDFEAEANLEEDDWLESLESNTVEDEDDLNSGLEENSNNENEEDDSNEDELDLDSNDSDSNEEDDFNLEAFNKKLGKDFKTEKELIDFLKEKDSEEEVVDDEKIIEDSNAAIDYYSPLLQLNDKELMHKQGEAKATANGKDINDPDVQEEIEDEVQGMIDSYDLSVKASALRENLKGLVKKAETEKNNIELKKEKTKNELIVKEKEELQNSFANIHSKKTFFGIDTDKETITRAYKKAHSGKFLEELKADKSKLAEAAMLMEMKEKIHKKSSGLSYSDGIAAALEQYESSKGNESIIKAQRSGSSGSSSNSKDLVNDFIK